MEVLFQCPACKRLVAVSSARAAELRVFLRCVECGEETGLDLEGGDAKIAVTRSDIATALGDEPRPVDDEDPGLAKLRAALDELEVPEGAESVAVGFDRLLTRWDDETEHARLIKASAAAGQLAALGQRYRVVLTHRPGDARATASQERIIGTAMATMTPASFTMKPAHEPGGARLVILAVLGLATVGALVFIWMRYAGGL